MRKKQGKVKGVFEKIEGSDRWWIRYADRTGRIRYEFAGTRGQAISLVEKRRNETRVGRKLPENLRKRVVTVADLAPAALAYSQTNHGKRHQANVRQQLRHLLKWFGSHAADELTPSEIQAGIAAHMSTAATFNRYKAALSLVYRVAAQDSRIQFNPVRSVPQKRENNARIRFFTELEEARIRAVIRKRCPEREPEFDLAVYTGMRRSEQYGLRWANVDFATGIITIPRSKHGERRYLPINSGAAPALNQLLRYRKDDHSPVCPGGMGRRGYLHRWFFELLPEAGFIDLESAGLDMAWHVLRHTYISRLVMRGVDIRSVQELAGHKTIQMTMRYAHLAPDHLREASEKSVSKPIIPEPTESRTESGVFDDSLVKKQVLQ